MSRWRRARLSWAVYRLGKFLNTACRCSPPAFLGLLAAGGLLAGWQAVAARRGPNSTEPWSRPGARGRPRRPDRVPAARRSAEGAGRRQVAGGASSAAAQGLVGGRSGRRGAGGPGAANARGGRRRGKGPPARRRPGGRQAGQGGDGGGENRFAPERACRCSGKRSASTACR